jgi:hypothetical protein
VLGEEEAEFGKAILSVLYESNVVLNDDLFRRLVIKSKDKYYVITVQEEIIRVSVKENN